MPKAKPNVFTDIFNDRPRADLTRRENALAQAFAHILRRYPEIGKRWFAHVAGVDEATLISPVEVLALRHPRLPSGQTAVTPLRLRCVQDNGRIITLVFVLKWDSALHLQQFISCRDFPSSRTAPGLQMLSALCFTRAQQDEARPYCDSVFLWEDLPAILGNSTEHSLLHEFYDFLAEQASSYRAFTRADLVAEVEGSRLLTYRMLRQLKLLQWRCLPLPWRDERAATPIGHYGCAALLFGTEGKPGILMGVQGSHPGLGFNLCNPGTGPDLIFSLTVDLPTRQIDSEALQSRLSLLQEMATSVLGPHERGDYYQKVVVRTPLAMVIGETETAREQLDAIYAELQRWCFTFFGDHQLLRILRQPFE